MSAELRVEDLARRADVTVDTIRFYQKRRLLPPPRHGGRLAWYDDEHVNRLARIRELQARGLSLAVIQRLVEGQLDPADEPLFAAVTGAQTNAADLLDLDGLAQRSGVPAALLEAVSSAGLLVPQTRHGATGYTEADADLVVAGVRLLETGLPLSDLLDLARRHHDATRAIAEDAVAMFDRHVRAPLRDAELDDDEKARRLVDAFRTLLDTVTMLVEHHFRTVLLAVAQEHLEHVDATEDAAGSDVTVER